MSSPSTPLPEPPTSCRKNPEQGFSLLEVIVALAIMAAGFLILMKLFSGSIRSVDLSDQYMKAVMLGNSKLAELELVDFRTNEDSGTFESHDRFQWELDVRPYESPLNDGGSNIELSQVVLRVSWEDGSKDRNIELTTVRLAGTSLPQSDAQLAKLFAGGPGTLSQEGEETDDPSSPSPSQPPHVSGADGSAISGGRTPRISGAP